MRCHSRLLVFVACLLCVAPALGQYPRDAAANKKIDEALNVHYLGTDFKKAEDVLLGTIQACDTKCKPATVGRAWMYVGVVRGSGNKDQAGARAAFEQALKADPAVTLDAELASPETKKTFQELGGQIAAEDVGPSDTASGGEAGPIAAAPSETRAGLKCTPGSASVQTRRPVPVACRGDGEASNMSLRYKEFGADEWVTVSMTKVGEFFQGEITCEATRTPGPLHYFVVATDAAGDPVDTLGSKGEPVVIQVGEQVTDEPPAFPGQAAPERCAPKEICPPDFPGCGGAQQAANRGQKEWGASCSESAECESGLLCIKGSCETAPSCVVDADCETGVCRAGKCDIPVDEGMSTAGYQKNYVGIHFALDVGFVGGSDVCRANQSEYDCYYQGSDDPYPPMLPAGIGSPGEPGDAYPGAGIGNGLAGGTMRVLLSYDRALTSNLTIGGRVGFAFGGGPSRPGDPAFLPVHVEARLGYWFLGLGSSPMQPYAHLTAGMAQVDLHTEVIVSDCSTEPSYDDFLDCIDASGDYDSANDPDLPTEKLDAYKKLGQGFAGAGAGVAFAVADSIGAQLNVNVMYMFPDTGLVIEPSFGGVYAF